MSTRSRTLIALVAGAVFGFSAAVTSGVWPSSPGMPRSRQARPPTLPWEEARLFAEVYERIKREYVDEVDDHALMEKAIRGMVAALDPHSAYLDSDEFEEIRLSTMGSYPGVGIEVVGGGFGGEDPAADRRLARRAGRPAARRPDREDRRQGYRRGSRRRHRADARARPAAL